MSLPLRQKVTLTLLLLYWPGIFILAHIPIPRLVYRAQVSDKSLHFIAYLVLVFALWFAISPDKKVSWRKANTWWVVFVVVSYGLFDELLQGWVGRSCDVNDFLANLGGAVTGLVLFTFVTFWPGFLVVTAVVIFLLTNLAQANMADLLPVTSTVFYIFAYGFLTWLWIRNMRLFLSTKAPQLKWLIRALVWPVAFLLTVKLFSVIMHRTFTMRSVLLSAAGIAAVVMALFLTALRRGCSGQKSSPVRFERPV